MRKKWFSWFWLLFWAFAYWPFAIIYLMIKGGNKNR